ncbi:hypothetical protein CRENPOLYSF2_2910011 [Crenothrix polyspora]|uniref:Uncharacterized protein n=1 Tax=Crenothrix polyspora TaxID=360316 RepID=A0A1R4H9G1_9GAMM|nr:hypothetical protein CRENPOLYSF2_2910011 [Crenothrix polyspora]
MFTWQNRPDIQIHWFLCYFKMTECKARSKTNIRTEVLEVIILGVRKAYNPIYATRSNSRK